MKAMPKVALTAVHGVDMVGLVRRIVDQITGIEAAGIKAAGIKAAGFIKFEKPGKKGKSEIIIGNLNGEEVVVGVQGKGRGRREGKHLVDVDVMEEALLGAIGFKSGGDLYVIHEIGPLETMSRTFSTAAKMLLKNEKVAVLATVAKKGRGFVREVKRLPGINALEVTDVNASAIEEKVVKEFLTAFTKRAATG